MKHLHLLLITLLCFGSFPHFANAQNQLALGVSVNPGLTFDLARTRPSPGFDTGLQILVHLKKQQFIRCGAGYLLRRDRHIRASTDGDRITQLTFHYLNLPFTYNFGVANIGRAKIFLSSGFELSILARAHAKTVFQGSVEQKEGFSMGVPVLRSGMILGAGLFLPVEKGLFLTISPELTIDVARIYAHQTGLRAGLMASVNYDLGWTEAENIPVDPTVTMGDFIVRDTVHAKHREPKRFRFGLRYGHAVSGMAGRNPQAPYAVFSAGPGIFLGSGAHRFFLDFEIIHLFDGFRDYPPVGGAAGYQFHFPHYRMSNFFLQYSVAVHNAGKEEYTKTPEWVQEQRLGLGWRFMPNRKVRPYFSAGLMNRNLNASDFGLFGQVGLEYYLK